MYQQTVSQQTFSSEDVLNYPFERSWSSELGFEKQLTPLISLDTTGFYKTVDRIAVANPELRDVNVDDLYVPDGIGRIYGLEAMLRKRSGPDPFFGWVAYTLSRSERQDEEGGDWYSFVFDQTHNLVALGGVRLPYDLEFSARTQYISGSPYTPQLEGYYDLDVGTYQPVAGATNSERLPAYFTVDVRAAKTWTWRRIQLMTYLDVLGVVQGENPQGIEYNYDYTKTTIVGGLPLIPSLGFELKAAF